jgi:serine/threonine protein kinase
MAEHGTLVGQRYRLRRLLGEGGAAEVWLAHDIRVDRPVALKLLHSHFARNPSVTERFRREAHIVAQMDSPYIVQVYDVEVRGTESFIAMEFVEGQDLRDRLRFEAPLPVSLALSLLRDIASGIAVAHRAGLVHRDLKPANILISRRGEVKITDFGIARSAAHPGQTEPGTVWGTSHYLAPEQAMGHAVSPATDVYALGVLLFEMLAAQVPFPGDDPIATAIAHIQEPVPDVRALNPTVPYGVATLLSRMMAKSPEKRPANAGVLVQMLEGYLSADGQATIVRPILDDADLPVGQQAPVAARLAPAHRHSYLAVLFLALFILAGGVVALAAREMGALAEPVPAEVALAPPTTASPTPSVRIESATLPEPSMPTPPPATITPIPPTPAPSSSRAGNAPEARALYLQGRPAVRVDGNLSEWTSVAIPVGNLISGADRWAGPADLGGTARFAWDDLYLYLGVEKVDDYHVQGESGYRLNRGDFVELWLDANTAASGAPDRSSRSVFLFGLSPGDFETLRPEGVVYYPLPRDDERNHELRVGAQPFPDGYTLEARVPWSLLGIEPSEGMALGYAVVFNDRDDPETPVPVTRMSSTLHEPFQNPATFGNLILLP